MSQPQIIRLQICQKCDTHPAVNSHSEHEYKEAYQILKAYLSKLEINTIRNLPPKYLRKVVDKKGEIKKYIDINNNRIVEFPPMGAFEVYYLGILIYSKLETSTFPNIQCLCALIGEVRKIYLRNSSILGRLQRFRDVEYEWKKKTDPIPSLYTQLKLNSYGNETPGFALDLLLKQGNKKACKEKESVRNSLRPYSFLTSNQKSNKMKSIYCSKQYHSLQKNNYQNSQELENQCEGKRKRPRTGWKRQTFTQREGPKGNYSHHYNWTQRNEGSAQKNIKRNSIFKLILKQGSHNITKQKINEAMKDQSLLSLSFQKQVNPKQRIRRRDFSNTKANKTGLKQLKRHNIYFWHLDGEIEKDKQNQNEIVINFKEVGKIGSKKTCNNIAAKKNRDRAYKKCSITKRVSQNYFQGILSNMNNDKESTCKELSRNKVEFEKMMTSEGISKIDEFESQAKTFHLSSVLTSKQNMKTAQKVQKQSLKAQGSQKNQQVSSNKKTKKEENFRIVNLFSINLDPINQNNDPEYLKNKQFNDIFKQYQDPVPANRQINHIIEEESSSTSRESEKGNNFSQHSQYSGSFIKENNTEQVNRRRASIEQFTVSKRISQRKRSSNHQRTSQYMQKFNTLQMQIQLTQRQDQDCCMDDGNLQYSNSQQFYIEDNTKLKQWEQYSQIHPHVREPAQIIKKFVQIHNFEHHAYANKYHELIKDGKNKLCEFKIKGEELANDFVIKSIRQIYRPTQIRLFPPKFAPIEINESTDSVLEENEEISNVSNKSYPNSDKGYEVYPTKLVHVVNFMIRSNPLMLTRIFEDKKNVNPYGVYCIWLRNLKGLLQPIFVNDSFAFEQAKNNNGENYYKPIYSWLVNGKCLWYMILEKAVAKVLGSYYVINEASLTQLFSIVIGTPTQQIKEESPESLIKTFEQKLLQDKTNTICALRGSGASAEGCTGLKYGTRIDRIVGLKYNQQNPRESTIILKEELETTLSAKQFVLQYSEISLLHYNYNFYYNQTSLSVTLLNQSTILTCRFKVKSPSNHCFLVLPDHREKVSLYHHCFEDELEIAKLKKGNDKVIYDGNIYQKIEFGSGNRAQFMSISLDMGQYIYSIPNNGQETFFLIIFSQFPVFIGESCIQELKMVEESEKKMHRKTKKKTRKGYISEQQSIYQTSMSLNTSEMLNRSNKPSSKQFSNHEMCN